MNCIKCYQEIPEGSKFCPYCGAEQTSMPDAGNVNEQPESTVQPEVNAQEAEPQQEETVQRGKSLLFPEKAYAGLSERETTEPSF